MGCDIHVHVEIKIGGKWHHYSQPDVDRNYTLFARMAGVRNGNMVDPIAEPRGLPEDVSYTTRFVREYDGVDGHSDSWLSADEVVGLGEWMREQAKQWGADHYSIESQFGYIFGNGWDIKKYPNDYPSQLEDARIVFWFDN